MTFRAIGNILKELGIFCVLLWILSILLDGLSVAFAPLNFFSGLAIIGVLLLWVKRLMKIKNTGVVKFFGLAILLGCLMGSNAACTRVDAAHVGVHISYAGTYRGVQDVPVVTGYVFYVPGFSTVMEYPTAIQTVVWTKNPHEGSPNNEEITFTNADALVVSCDVSVGFHLESEKVPQFYLKFRSDLSDDGDVTSWADGYFHNVTRDAFNEHGGNYHIEEIMGNNSKFLTEVKNNVQTQMTPYGVIIDQFGLIGACRPPQNVIDAINLKVGAQQLAFQKQNELAQAQADAAKAVAKAKGQADAEVTSAQGDAAAAIERAQGDAKANQVLSQSLTPNVLEWKRLQIQSQWDGKLPNITGGALPMISIPHGGGQ